MPFLGLCLGMQCAVIEFARNVCELAGANSTEFDAATPHPVVDFMPEQRGIERIGGTMRLGVYPCAIEPGSKAADAYGETLVHERHRHRHELNNAYSAILTEHGLKFSGISPERSLIEILELSDHPWDGTVSSSSGPLRELTSIQRVCRTARIEMVMAPCAGI